MSEEVYELTEDAGAQTALPALNASLLLHYTSLGATDKEKLGRTLHIFHNSGIIVALKPPDETL